MAQLTSTQIRDDGSTFNDVIELTNSGGTRNATLCRAWVNFNGQGVVAIRTSFNVDAIVDEGTAVFTINFTNNLNSANYAAAFGNDGNASQGNKFSCGNPTFYAVGSLRMSVRDAGGAGEDPAIGTAMIYS